MHLTHGAISRAVRLLEDDLGVTLFDRRSRRVFLTDAGRHLAQAVHEGRMRAEGQAAQQITHTSYRHAYWTMAQLLAHHSVNGCDLQPGDLLGTGTLSGPTSSEAGALLELTEGGKKPVALANGESRTFLQDGDAVILRGWCEKPGAARIGFGECRATVLPARQG